MWIAPNTIPGVFRVLRFGLFTLGGSNDRGGNDGSCSSDLHCYNVLVDSTYDKMFLVKLFHRSFDFIMLEYFPETDEYAVTMHSSTSVNMKTIQQTKRGKNERQRGASALHHLDLRSTSYKFVGGKSSFPLFSFFFSA